MNQNQEEDPLSSSASRSDSAHRREPPHILIVEDSRADLFLIREAIENVCLDADLQVVSDGEKAVRFFEGVDKDPSLPEPDLIILDMNLPKKQGEEVLQEMRKSRRCARAPVLVVTSSDSDRDREAMASLGVSGYFRKPSEYDDFMKLGGIVEALLTGRSPGSLT